MLVYLLSKTDILGGEMRDEKLLAIAMIVYGVLYFLLLRLERTKKYAKFIVPALIADMAVYKLVLSKGDKNIKSLNRTENTKLKKENRSEKVCKVDKTNKDCKVQKVKPKLTENRASSENAENNSTGNREENRNVENINDTNNVNNNDIENDNNNDNDKEEIDTVPIPVYRSD